MSSTLRCVGVEGTYYFRIFDKAPNVGKVRKSRLMTSILVIGSERVNRVGDQNFLCSNNFLELTKYPQAIFEIKILGVGIG